jgi:hypothetical protein
MKIVRSISYPELSISDEGDVFDTQTGQRINLKKNHGLSVRGYVITYRIGQRYKTLSLVNLVYEAHVKRAKITASDYVEFLDGDEYNPKASNLTCFRASQSKKAKPFKREPGESYSTWMNGHEELYC